MLLSRWQWTIPGSDGAAGDADWQLLWETARRVRLCNACTCDGLLIWHTGSEQYSNRVNIVYVRPRSKNAIGVAFA